MNQKWADKLGSIAAANTTMKHPVHQSNSIIQPPLTPRSPSHCGDMRHRGAIAQAKLPGKNFPPRLLKKTTVSNKCSAGVSRHTGFAPCGYAAHHRCRAPHIKRAPPPPTRCFSHTTLQPHQIYGVLGTCKQAQHQGIHNTQAGGRASVPLQHTSAPAAAA